MALGKFSPDSDTNHATVDVRHRARAPLRTRRHAVHALGSCLAFTLTSRDAILIQVKAVTATVSVGLVGWRHIDFLLNVHGMSKANGHSSAKTCQTLAQNDQHLPAFEHGRTE